MAGVDETILQPFTLDINTFPGKMKLWVDGVKAEPGTDFVMREYSPGIHGEYKLYYIDTLNYDSAKIFEDLEKPENKDAFVVCDFWFTYKHSDDFKRLQADGGSSNAGLLLTWDEPLKFYKAYGERVADKPTIWTTAELIRGAHTIKADIDNEFLEGYRTENVIASIRGERHDSCYVFIAHYDHLGNLGRRLYFGGANDNASGTAGIITLAEYYSVHKPLYDMYFISFSGEDANLRGSTYYMDHPVVPHSEIKYVFNLDMIGDNNPVQYCEVSGPGMAGFALMEEINSREHYFEAFNRGELAANSDHYVFALKDVPCIMFENEEGDAFKYYHTAQDSWSNSFSESYESVFKLITSFISLYDKK